MQDNTSICQSIGTINLEEVIITQEQYNDILNIQQEILSLLASHGNFTSILERLCSMAESLLPNSVASIMLLNHDTGLISILSAPSVPEVGHKALANLKPGPTGGSCGNAVFHNKAQYVTDTFTDSRWGDIRQVAYDFNICSCWSMPVQNEHGDAIGTFALSSFEHRAPAPFHKKLLETAASIVKIVLKNKDDDRKLRLFSTAMQNAQDGMIITNENNEIIEVNTAFEEIYGYKEKEVLGKDPKMFSAGENTPNFYKEMWNHINTKHSWSGEITNKRVDNSVITQWMSISSIVNDQDKDAQNYLAIFSDLSELKESQNKIEKMLHTDILTKLYNKSHLDHEISNDEEQTLILLNVNNFGYINTAYGFEIGDKLLQEIAKIIQNKFSATLAARINSDEFALLFNEKINIQEKIESIQNYFNTQQIQIDEIFFTISFSYGANYDKKYLFSNTVLALKQAKEGGKNRYHIYTKDDNKSTAQQREAFITSHNLFYNALSDNKITPYFQGIRDNRTNKITKYESLARIIDGEKIISPFFFLESARLAGKLPEITKIIIEKSFQVMKLNTYTFSINITEDDLTQDYLVEYLDRKCTQHNIDSSRVILEILEGVSSNGKRNHIKQLKQLKAKGFMIAIDDFGTEYSNFERVLDLDIDFLKIDAKYIKDIHTNKKSYEITRAIAYFAKNANIPCIAEFVHNKEVQVIIEELEIDFSQGYLFSEPAPLP